MSFGWLITICTVLSVVAVVSSEVAERRRRNALSLRERISLESWIDLYSSNDRAYRHEIQQVLTILATEIGIEPTQLRPTDRFDRELCLRKVLIDDGLDLSDQALDAYFKRRFQRRWVPLRPVATVGELLTEVIGQCKRQNDGGSKRGDGDFDDID